VTRVASLYVSPEQKVAALSTERWPQLVGTVVRHRARYAYLDAELLDGIIQPLCRLRYTGSAHQWAFAIYCASHDDYQDSVSPSGYPVGIPKEALDCACGLYLGDPHRLDLNP